VHPAHWGSRRQCAIKIHLQSRRPYVCRFHGPPPGGECEPQQPGGQPSPVFSAVQHVPDVRSADRDGANSPCDVLERARTSHDVCRQRQRDRLSAATTCESASSNETEPKEPNKRRSPYFFIFRPLYFHPVVSSIFLLCFFLFSSPNFSRRKLDAYHTSTYGVPLVRI